MKMTLNKVVGNNIKMLRTRANMLQGRLAEILKISVTAMSLYEKGERSVPLDHLKTISNIFNVSIDNLLSNFIFEEIKECEISFEHFKFGSSTIYSAGESKISNPHSVYFTLDDASGDTLVFLRCNEVTPGVMLVSESPILRKLDNKNVSEIPNKRLFLTTIEEVNRHDGNDPLLSYTDNKGIKYILKNKSMFLYYGVQIACIKHLERTEEFFSSTND